MDTNEIRTPDDMQHWREIAEMLGWVRLVNMRGGPWYPGMIHWVTPSGEPFGHAVWVPVDLDSQMGPDVLKFYHQREFLEFAGVTIG